MPVHVAVMDRGRGLPEWVRNHVLDQVMLGVAVIERHAPHLDVDLAIVPTDIHDHPRWYRSGKAFGTGYAQIEFNPDHPLFESEWPREGAALVVHELHHCLRWPHSGSRWTLGDIVVLEGLAMLAEATDGLEPLDYGPPPSAEALTDLCARVWDERGRAETETTAWFRETDVDGEDLDAPVNYYVGHHMMTRAVGVLEVDAFAAALLPTATLLDAWNATRSLSP